MDRKRLLEKYRIREPEKELIDRIVGNFFSNRGLHEEFKRRFPSLAKRVRS
jgi:hypothetical protein